MANEYAPPIEEVRRVLTYDGNPDNRFTFQEDEGVYVTHASGEFIDLNSVAKIVLTPANGEPITFEANSETVEVGTLKVGMDYWPCLYGKFNGITAPVIIQIPHDLDFVDFGYLHAGTYLCSYENEIMVGYISRIEYVETKTAPISSSLSYHEAYPEFIEHLKNRKYDSPKTTIHKTITHDGANRYPVEDNGYACSITSDCIDLNSVTKVILKSDDGFPDMAFEVNKDNSRVLQMDDNVTTLYGKHNGVELPILIVVYGKPNILNAEVGTYAMGFCGNGIFGFINHVEYDETVN